MTANPHRGRVPDRQRRLTKTQRLHFERLLLNVEALRDEGCVDYRVQASVPEAWDTLEADVDVAEPKVKLTLRLDRSVAAFYRAMGQGYQARINRILATFAQMRIAEVKRLEEMVDAELAAVQGLRE